MDLEEKGYSALAEIRSLISSNFPDEGNHGNDL